MPIKYMKLFIYNQIVGNTNVYTNAILYIQNKIQLCSQTCLQNYCNFLNITKINRQ